jgi:hypothetical protein
MPTPVAGQDCFEFSRMKRLESSTVHHVHTYNMLIPYKLFMQYKAACRGHSAAHPMLPSDLKVTQHFSSEQRRNDHLGMT